MLCRGREAVTNVETQENPMRTIGCGKTPENQQQATPYPIMVHGLSATKLGNSPKGRPKPEGASGRVSGVGVIQ